jgi:hypothetical protein
MCSFPWQRWLSGLVLVGICALLAALVVRFINHLRQDAWHTESRNNLHQLGLALHNYHDVHAAFPPGGVIGEDGTAFHGWYTQILPYVDSSPLYNAINQHKPWNDPENADLFYSSHPVCRIPDVEEIATVEGFGLIHYAGNPHVLHRNSHVSLADLVPGVKQTWLAGEAAGGYVPWCYPFNWRRLGNKLNAGPASFGRPSGDGALLLMGDGAVRFVGNEIDPAILQRLNDAPPHPPAEALSVPPYAFEYSSQPGKVIRELPRK